jgi:hypothetical protein
MNSKPTEAQYLSRLRQEVEEQIGRFAYTVPDHAFGNPMTEAAVGEGLAQTRGSLVEPYWEEVEVRDTYEQIGMSTPLRRKCVLVADDGKGMLLLFDPAEESFVLAHRVKTGLTTFGVRGDAVGCFLSR